MNKAVFLDRDGVVIVDKEYLCDPSGVEFIAGAVEALRRLQDAGFLLVVISNQSVIGRGMCADYNVEEVHEHMDKLLAQEGVKLSSIYYCPHAPEDGCDCRKPKPGMLNLAIKEFDIDASASAMVGDKPSDVEAGEAAGCGLNILVGPASGGAKDLSEAAELILAEK